jgi:hypothetical protein
MTVCGTQRACALFFCPNEETRMQLLSAEQTLDSITQRSPGETAIRTATQKSPLVLCNLVGNKTYCDSQKIFKCKLVSQKAKLELQWTIIVLVITYASEA